MYKIAQITIILIKTNLYAITHVNIIFKIMINIVLTHVQVINNMKYIQLENIVYHNVVKNNI